MFLKICSPFLHCCSAYWKSHAVKVEICSPFLHCNYYVVPGNCIHCYWNSLVWGVNICSQNGLRCHKKVEICSPFHHCTSNFTINKIHSWRAANENKMVPHPISLSTKNKIVLRRSHIQIQYQSQVSILGPVGYGPTTLPLRHSDGWWCGITLSFKSHEIYRHFHRDSFAQKYAYILFPSYLTLVSLI